MPENLLQKACFLLRSTVPHHAERVRPRFQECVHPHRWGISVQKGPQLNGSHYRLPSVLSDLHMRVQTNEVVGLSVPRAQTAVFEVVTRKGSEDDGDEEFRMKSMNGFLFCLSSASVNDSE